jgi:hypothetical protein
VPKKWPVIIRFKVLKLNTHHPLSSAQRTTVKDLFILTLRFYEAGRYNKNRLLKE